MRKLWASPQPKMSDFGKMLFSENETLVLSTLQCFSCQRNGTNALKSVRILILCGHLEKAQVLPSSEL